MIETELDKGKKEERNCGGGGGNASGGVVTRERGSCTEEGLELDGDGGNTRARDGGWGGSGCLNSTETLRAFCMFAFVMIERWLAPCLLLIHEL